MKILLLGDSLFARHEGKEMPHIEYSLKQVLPELSIENWAVSGDNSFDLLQRLAQKELPQADKVFVFIGTNDLARHKQVFLGEYLNNLNQIVTHLKTRFAVSQIYLLTPTPVDEVKQVYRDNRLVTYYGDVVKEVATNNGISVLDTRLLFQNLEIDVSELLKGSLDDGLHFGGLAYEIIAKTMIDIALQ